MANARMIFASCQKHPEIFSSRTIFAWRLVVEQDFKLEKSSV